MLFQTQIVIFSQNSFLQVVFWTVRVRMTLGKTICIYVFKKIKHGEKCCIFVGPGSIDREETVCRKSVCRPGVEKPSGRRRVWKNMYSLWPAEIPSPLTRRALVFVERSLVARRRRCYTSIII